MLFNAACIYRSAGIKMQWVTTLQQKETSHPNSNELEILLMTYECQQLQYILFVLQVTQKILVHATKPVSFDSLLNLSKAKQEKN